MRLFFKQCYSFSMALPEVKVYYPVVNIHTQALQYYDSYTAQRALEKVKLKQQSEIEVTPANMKQFFLGQVKTDMYSMYKPKELLLLHYQYMIDSCEIIQEKYSPSPSFNSTFHIKIIFIGRSNVGKSSLINSIFKRKVAKASKKQGSTKKLYYYELIDNLGYIIDAPGYGYSAVNIHAKRKWQGMIYDYISISTRLARVYLLINAEHGLKKNDLSLLSQIQKQNVNIQIVLTKTDRVTDRTLYDTMLSIGMQVKGFTNIHPLLHACSSKEGFGIQELKNSIYDSIANFEPRNVDDKEEVLLKFLESYRCRPKEFDTFFGKDALKSPKEQSKLAEKPKELPGSKFKADKSSTKRIKDKQTTTATKSANPKEIN